MVNITKLKLTHLQQDILRLLYLKVGTVLNQRNISMLLNVSQPAVMKSLPDLQKSNQNAKG